jgi:hypothetical protein|tara:strand:+ start:1453 stop:4974 length:3522 start_codon:yes stop_codon:yes gene_type:complete
MPTQALNTTSGNWRARLKAEFHDARGRHWRVELIDSDITSGHTGFGVSSSTIIDSELTQDGFVLNWDGPTDHVGASIIPSSCEVTWVVTNNDLETLKNVIKDSNDSRLGMAIYYDSGETYWKPYWVGVLNHEAIEYETKDLPYLIKLVANCGLNRLSNVEYTNDGATYTDEVSLATTMARCINKIPTANFWSGSEPQLSEVVDMFSKDHWNNYTGSWMSSAGDPYPISVIERSVVSSLTFSEGGDVEEDDYGRRIKMPPNFTSCLDVLENIANAFGARITMARHSFWFFPANALNWDHTLKVQKWTRAQVSSETIQTVQVIGNNADTASNDLVNFRYDIESTHALGDGWSNSYLLPVKRCTLSFRNAGLRSIHGNPKNFYLDYPNNGSGSMGFTNPNITVSENDTLSLRGIYSGGLVKEFGLATGAAFDTYGEDRIGARIILRFKIILNSASGTKYYYGSEYSVTGNTTNIDMPTFWDNGGTNPQRVFNKITLDDPSWSTNEKFYDVIIPWTNSTPPAAIKDVGTYMVGGLHLNTEDGGFEYRINSSQWDDVSHSFDFTCLPIPADLSSYNGVDVQVDRIVLTRNGTLKQTFPELNNIFMSSYANQSYNYDGSTNSSNNSEIPNDRVDDFQMILGSVSDDADWDLFVEQSENSEYLDCGDTTIGSNYTINGAGSDGSLKLIKYLSSSTSPQLNSTPEWNSITDVSDDLEGDTELQFAMLREQLYQRGKALSVQRGNLVPQRKLTATNTPPIDILNVIHHNCSTTADVEDYLVPFRLTHVGSTESYTVDSWMIGRERISFTSDEGKIPKGGGGSSGGGGGGVGPTGFEPAYPIGGASDAHQDGIIAEATVSLKSFVGSSLTSPPSSGSKLMMLGSDGVLAQLPDGTSGQVLSTNGSGAITFIDPPATTTQTTTPTGAVDDDTPNFGATVTWTATNYDGVTTYIPKLERASDGTIILSGTDFTQNGAVVTYTHPSNSVTHQLNITAVSAGKTESARWSDLITGAANVASYSYFRFQNVNGNSNAHTAAIHLSEIQIYSQANYQGTDNPTTAATGGNQNSSGLSNFSISHGYESTASQGNGRSWNAFDDSNNSGWSNVGLGKTQAALNWIQIQFLGSGGAPAGSIKCIVDESLTHSSSHIKVMGSNTGAFSGEETTITTFGPLSSGNANTVHSWAG